MFLLKFCYLLRNIFRCFRAHSTIAYECFTDITKLICKVGKYYYPPSTEGDCKEVLSRDPGFL